MSRFIISFDTIKHDLIIDRLQIIELSYTVLLLWFISYIQNRYLSINIYNEYSSTKVLK